MHLLCNTLFKNRVVEVLESFEKINEGGKRVFLAHTSVKFEGCSSADYS
ncbi:hypothetical protein [Desulfurococcus sp.]